MENDKKLKNYNRGRAIAITGMIMSTIALAIYFFGGSPFYYAIFFLLGMVLGFTGALFILVSMRKK